MIDRGSVSWIGRIWRGNYGVRVLEQDGRDGMVFCFYFCVLVFLSFLNMLLRITVPC